MITIQSRKLVKMAHAPVLKSLNVRCNTDLQIGTKALSETIIYSQKYLIDLELPI